MLTVRRCVSLVWAALVILPLITCALWLSSGRETLTKSFRTVEVAVNDELFGDSTDETLLIHGPIVGYFIGLDAVIVTSAVSFSLLSIAGWRRRRRRKEAIGRKESVLIASAMPCMMVPMGGLPRGTHAEGRVDRKGNE